MQIDIILYRKVLTGGVIVTEWITSGNLKYYNFVDAFHDLRKVDWRQYANYEEGDIVYIYSSGNEQMI